MTELKPCPFCGDEAFFEYRPKSALKRKSFYVVCKSCSCKKGWFTDETDATQSWNKRTDTYSEVK